MAREYHFYIGEPVGTVGLWKRYDDDYADGETPVQFTQEYPIAQNTRGRMIWNSDRPDETNMNCCAPTDEFWAALKQIADGQPEEPIEADVEWYEAEIIESVINMALTFDGEELPTEIGGLLAYAKEGKWKGGDGNE